MNNNTLLESTPRNIFILYLMLSANFLGNLFGCKTQQAFKHTMWIKHLIGFMTMYFFIVLVDFNKQGITDSPQKQLLFTVFCYSIFIVSTKMDYKWWMGFIFVLSVYYILEVYSQHQNTNDQDKQKYKNYQKYLSYLALIILVTGFFIYLGKRKLEYQDSFSWTTFFLGKPDCALQPDTPVSDKQAFLNAFK